LKKVDKRSETESGLPSDRQRNHKYARRKNGDSGKGKAGVEVLTQDSRQMNPRNLQIELGKDLGQPGTAGVGKELVYPIEVTQTKIRTSVLWIFSEDRSQNLRAGKDRGRQAVCK